MSVQFHFDWAIQVDLRQFRRCDLLIEPPYLMTHNRLEKIAIQWRENTGFCTIHKKNTLPCSRGCCSPTQRQ